MPASAVAVRSSPIDRAIWERTFAVCWGGVYNGVRAFMPLLIASDDGHIVNTSSVNGFWASIGPDRPHTAYSAAKFAVKGFSEALITDLRVNAPHVKVSVVMPGHIGTSIVENSMRHGGHEVDMEAAEMVQADVGHVPRPSADDRRRGRAEILDGVRAGRWRILVGDDARKLDEAVRANPEIAYESLTVGDLTSGRAGTPFSPDDLTASTTAQRNRRGSHATSKIHGEIQHSNSSGHSGGSRRAGGLGMRQR